LNKKYLTLASLYSITLISCSKGNRPISGNDPNTGIVDTKPKNADEALKRLSPQHRANFEAWQTRILKSCSAGDVFGLDSNKKKMGIDPSILFRKNNSSAIFSNEKSFAVLGGYNTFKGVSETKSDQKINVNGQEYQISASTAQTGINCSVYLFGEKIHEAEIVENFEFGIQFSPKEVNFKLQQQPSFASIGAQGFSELRGHSLSEFMTNVLSPTEKIYEMLEEKLQISKEQLPKLFLLKNTSLNKAVVSISNEESATYVDAQNFNLISQGNILEKYFSFTSDPSPEKNLTLDIRQQIPKFKFKNAENFSDNGNLKLLINLTVEKRENEIFYNLKEFKNEGISNYSLDEGGKCTQKRFLAYFLSSLDSKKITPSTQTVLFPCQILFPEIENVSYENGFFRSVIPQVFSSVVASPTTDYNGWENILSKFSKKLFLENKSISNELDPLNKTLIVSSIEKYFEKIKKLVDNSKYMQPAINESLQMGFDWSLRNTVVPDEKIADIISAIDNVNDVFGVSSLQLLNNLGKQTPSFYETQLSYSKGIDFNFKEEAKKALSLSKELNYDNFEKDIFNNMIQKQVSMNEIQNWSNQLLTIKTEIVKYPNLEKIKGNIVSFSIKAIQKQEMSIGEIEAAYLALDRAIIPFEQSTSKLIVDLNTSYVSHKESLDYAKNISQEFKDKAVSVRDKATKAENADWASEFFNSILQNKTSNEQLQQFESLWNSTLAFVERENAKMSGNDSVIEKGDRKDILQVAIAEIWGENEFNSLESIALLAKTSTKCAGFASRSSLAKCIGKNLFSKKDKMLLSPVYGGRYALLAQNFTDYTNKLSGFSDSSLKQLLLSEFFGFEAIWSNCSNDIFNQKSGNLKNQVSDYLLTSEQFKKFEIQRQIDETLQNCDNF
jgi:hypothetical protein